jgi:exoribonuclease-2
VLEQERLERGAQKVFKRDLVIDVADDGTFALREIDEHGPARGLVGEMMVLGNALLARFAVEKRIPVVFRRQEAPDEDRAPATSQDREAAPGEAAPGPAADYAGRSRLKKSSVGLEPGLHSGLGLDAYLQGTSPIRRYVDLCNQRQILSCLQVGTPHYSRSEMEEILYGTEEPLATAVAVSRETRRFWLLRYLKQRTQRPGKEARIITGTVLRTDLKNPLVELDEVFMPTMVKCIAQVKPGDRITLRISDVEPQQDYLRLEQII